jgi:Fe-Mn family superoxide dismutase
MPHTRRGSTPEKRLPATVVRIELAGAYLAVARLSTHKSRQRVGLARPAGDTFPLSIHNKYDPFYATLTGEVQTMADYVLPELPYDYAALEPHYSGEIVELHHDKHHAAYVAGANTTLAKLAEAREKGDFGSIVGLEKALAFHVSGHVLHSIFWKNLSPDGGDKPDGVLGKAIDEHFGSFEAFKAQLSQATTTIQGSGWGALAWEPLGKRLLIEQVYDHQGNIGNGSVPLLVFDAWEHAFYLQYKTAKADFVTALWNLVNWTDVTKRFESARQLTIS